MVKVVGLIDADGHVVEADAELLECLPAPFQGRADLLAFPFFPTLDGFHRQARRIMDGKGRRIAKGSLAEWRQFLDEDEIAWSALYPTTGLTFAWCATKTGPARWPRATTIIFPRISPSPSIALRAWR